MFISEIPSWVISLVASIFSALKGIPPLPPPSLIFPFRKTFLHHGIVWLYFYLEQIIINLDRFYKTSIVPILSSSSFSLYPLPYNFQAILPLPGHSINLYEDFLSHSSSPPPLPYSYPYGLRVTYLDRTQE